MEYYSTMKTNKGVINATTQISPQRRKAQKRTFYIIPLL
jgi:hypothetical protein